MSIPVSPGSPASAAPSPSRPLLRGADLLSALEGIGPRPALSWTGPEGRTELSGHVLANWIIKATGHLVDEIALDPGDLMVLDLPSHWKRTVLALSGWMLGARVVLASRAPEYSEETSAGGADADEVRVVATDRPGTGLAQSADEVLALDALSLSMGFSGELPPLAHDWVREIRASPDALGVALPAWSGPAPDPVSDGERVLLAADGADGGVDTRRALGAWLAGGGIVGPAAALSAGQRRTEGIDAEV